MEPSWKKGRQQEACTYEFSAGEKLGVAKRSAEIVFLWGVSLPTMLVLPMNKASVKCYAVILVCAGFNDNLCVHKNI